MTITLDDFIAKLPMPLIHATIQEHIFPLLQLMPDQRLKKVIGEMVLGILGGETPVITEIARQNNKRIEVRIMIDAVVLMIEGYVLARFQSKGQYLFVLRVPQIVGVSVAAANI